MRLCAATNSLIELATLEGVFDKTLLDGILQSHLMPAHIREKTLRPIFF